MRLLDYIAQSRAPFLVERASGVVCRLRSACDFAGQIATCPLRYVLSDELARTCAALAYTENRQLIDCLDLVRLPAERLWVEWPDAARRDELLRATPRITTDRPAVDVLRAGALIRASRSGRSGAMILFWTTRDRPNDPLVAALDTHSDLDGNLPVICMRCSTVRLQVSGRVAVTARTRSSRVSGTNSIGLGANTTRRTHSRLRLATRSCAIPLQPWRTICRWSWRSHYFLLRATDFPRHRRILSA
jgi:hypothetical protein